MSVWVFIMKSIYLYKRVSIRSKPFPHPLDKQTLRSHRRCSALHHRSLDVYSCKCKPFHVPTHQSKPFIACAATPYSILGRQAIFWLLPLTITTSSSFSTRPPPPPPIPTPPPPPSPPLWPPPPPPRILFLENFRSYKARTHTHICLQL